MSIAIKKSGFKILLLIYLLFLTSIGYGQVTYLDVQNPKELGLTNWVNNQDSILDYSVVEEINRKINILYDSTSVQIAVVVLKGDELTSARDLSMELFDEWKVGNKTLDNGLIILVLTQAHECFLRTGYGLEGCLTDALTTTIFNQKMKPFFKQNKWGEGVMAGLDACLEEIYKDYNNNGGHLTQKQEESFFDSVFVRGYLLLGLLLMIVAFIGLGITASKKGDIIRAEKYNSLKQGFKNWAIILIFCGIWTLPLLFIYYKFLLRRVRYKAVKCTCGNKMNLLSEKQEDEYLSDKEQFEESLGSRDYDVWLCKKCGKVRVFPYEINNTYTNCPVCYAKTMKRVSSDTVIQPTYHRNGVERITYVCKHCGHQHHKNIRIPKLVKSTPIVAGGVLGSSGGGSSIGGFSGGGFGGGMSGGGGGGGSW